MASQLLKVLICGCFAFQIGSSEVIEDRMGEDCPISCETGWDQTLCHEIAMCVFHAPTHTNYQGHVMHAVHMHDPDVCVVESIRTRGGRPADPCLHCNQDRGQYLAAHLAAHSDLAALLAL